MRTLALPLVVGSLLPLCGCGGAVADGPARLVLEPRSVDLGALAPATEREVEVAWRRAGAGALKVLAVESDCGCATVQGPRGILPAGARGRMRILVRGRRRPGPFEGVVRVYTDAPPPHDSLPLSLRGWSGAPVVAWPPVLDLGPRSPGARVERTLEVRWADAREGLRAVVSGLAGQVAVEPTHVAGRAGCLLRVVLTLPETPGPAVGEVRLAAAGAELLRVPVTAEVGGAALRKPQPARPDRVRPP